MSVWFYRESPGKFDSRTLSRETISRWTGGTNTATTTNDNNDNNNNNNNNNDNECVSGGPQGEAMLCGISN